MATHDEEDAFDIVQDAMMKMVQKHTGLTEPEWTAYFYRILYNKINDWYRRQNVRNRWRVFFKPKAGEEEYQPEDKFRQETYREPEQFLKDEEHSKRLLSAVEKLSLRQQQAITLRLWEGFSVAKTASIMGCSEGSVKTHFSRAISKLKQDLS